MASTTVVLGNWDVYQGPQIWLGKLTNFDGEGGMPYLVAALKGALNRGIL